MVRQIGMGYGIWESLAHLAGNRLGGHEKVWVTGVYGLSQVWIKTEATVVITQRRPRLSLSNDSPFLIEPDRTLIATGQRISKLMTHARHKIGETLAFIAQLSVRLA